MPCFSAWLNLLSSRSFSSFTFVYAASGLFMLLSAVICFYRGRKRVWMHRNYCISRTVMEGVKGPCLLHHSYTQKPHHFTTAEVLQKLKSMMINCTPRSGKKKVFFFPPSMLSTLLPETWWASSTLTFDLFKFARLGRLADARHMCVFVFMRSTSLAKMGD